MKNSSTNIEGKIQISDTRNLNIEKRDSLIITSVYIEGEWHVLSKYSDEIWKFNTRLTNVGYYLRSINFSRVDANYRDTVKAMVYRYHQSGRAGQKRPTSSTLRHFVIRLLPFLKFLKKLGISSLSQVTPMICANYAQECKFSTVRGKSPISIDYLCSRLLCVEAIYELSQYTDDQMKLHPWPESSASVIAGISGTGQYSLKNAKTPLIPDDIFSQVFNLAWDLVKRSDELFRLRDGIAQIRKNKIQIERRSVDDWINQYLKIEGWNGGLCEHTQTLTDLRTACYIVIASLSGCRNHELALLKTNSYYKTVGDDGEIYWWMKSESLKTDVGPTEWMVPEAAVTALRVMDRWAQPYQLKLALEIEKRKELNPNDFEIVEAEKHINAIFVGVNKHSVRTLNQVTWNCNLQKFLIKNKINWKISTHQFRRKFANYAGRSKFGDLRYLKEHFKHWTMDMTLLYALNDYQEMSLYLEVNDEIEQFQKVKITEWVDQNQKLAGGTGKSFMRWRDSRDLNLFKNHSEMVNVISKNISIRSNGHAWCTADNGSECIGNGGLNRIRCSDCNNSVIENHHAKFYEGLYDHLSALLQINDIGEAGLNRVKKDLVRCAQVLTDLGCDIKNRIE